MIELIATIIFAVSILAIVFILYSKAGALATLPRNGKTGVRNHHIVLNIENKIKDILLSFEKQILLHKFLSWAKCFVMKVEVKIDHLLHGIRKKAQQADKKTKK